MKYLCLVYGEEKALDALSKGETEALVDESLAYDDVQTEAALADFVKHDWSALYEESEANER